MAVEGDRPDCDEGHRCVRLRPGAAEDPRDVLDAFDLDTWPYAV